MKSLNKSRESCSVDKVQIAGRDELSALEAQRRAYEIAFGPIVFQVSRLMCKFGILKLLQENRDGLDYGSIIEKTGLRKYAVQVLMEASLFIGSVKKVEDKFFLTKTGWFLLEDEQVRINMNFNHDVNYLGMYELERSLLTGKPEGLKTLGAWERIYEGLASMNAVAQKSWFDFDHYYSDHAFSEALEILFSDPSCKLRRILDIGGNTGRWAVQCVKYDPDVHVTILDIPEQIGLLKKHVIENQCVSGRERIHAVEGDLLKHETTIPAGFDVIWMSQFLDCFSEKNIVSILRKTSAVMTADSKLYIMETLWDRQRFQTASFCLTLISLYFTAMANGESKMYHMADLVQCIESAGLKVETIHDHLGEHHTLICCRKKD